MIWFARIAAIVSILGCIGDFVLIFILGSHYPGYSQLHNTLSELGAPQSPETRIISNWWIILGAIFVLFGISIRAGYIAIDNRISWIAWLIIIYALGECFGSGIIPIQRVNGQLTAMGKLHDALGGIGITAIMILPYVLIRLFPKSEFSAYNLFLWIILIGGPVFLILFSIAKILNNPDNFFVLYKGLWQRLLSLNYYFCLISVAGRILFSESPFVQKA